MEVPITPPTENSPALSSSGAIVKPQARFRSTVFAVLRFAFGVAILLYLWKSGALHFRDFAKLIAQWPLSLAAIGDRKSVV